MIQLNKKRLLTFTSLASMLILGACSSNKGGNTSTGADGGSEGGSGSKKLTVYSNSLAGGRQEWIDEQAKKAGFDINYVEAGGGEIFNRLMAEASSPQADVAFGMDEAMFFTMQDEDMFVQYEPAWEGDIPEDAKVGDKYFYPLVEQKIFMMYNPEYVTEEEAPKNWQDLATTPELKGKYRVPAGVASGTDQKAFLSILLQYVDEGNGDMDISQDGWDAVKAYIDNGYQTPENEEQLQNFADGKVPVTYHFLGGTPNAEEEYGFDAVPVDPPQGVVTMREQIGVVNKGDDHDYKVAQEFVDWFGSDEIQSGFVKEFGGQPVNEKAYESAPERIREISEATTSMDIDWNFVRKHLDGWMEKIELELMP